MASDQSSDDFTKGNPRLPNPSLSGGTTTTPPIDVQDRRRRKKLIVLCDGTGQDSYGDTAQNPTNITRLARALAPNAWVKKENGEYEEWDQIVSYHAGIGTFAGNNAFGIMFGDGLSEIVRAAYGFLVNNWLKGDKIYIFGFSRGAYVARAIAGLVANSGLLTKRGMDNFHAVYETFYMKSGEDRTLKVMTADGKIDTTTCEKAGLRQVPPGTVEVVGVFDTVGFHAPIKSFLQKLHLDFFGSDKNEFQNTLLSEKVKYAFHALSLDEERIPFQTTLFFQPKEPNDRKVYKDENGKEWETCLKQVWFSGAHSDIGGGMQDPRLSNIVLAWMIDQLESRSLLAFNKTYLIDVPQPASTAPRAVPAAPTNGTDNPAPARLNPDAWGTSKGSNADAFSTKDSGVKSALQRVGYFGVHCILWPLLEGVKFVFVVITWPGSRWSRWWTGRRTPGEYVPIEDFKKRPEKKENYVTCESLHPSIKDRLMPPKSSRRWPWAQKEWWPCKPLHHWEYREEEEKWVKGKGNGWCKKGAEVEIKLAKVGDIEMLLKGRMRFKRVLTPWLAQVPIPVEEWAVPILDPVGQMA